MCSRPWLLVLFDVLRLSGNNMYHRLRIQDQTFFPQRSRVLYAVHSSMRFSHCILVQL